METIERDEADFKRWQERQVRKELDDLEQALDELVQQARTLASEALTRLGIISILGANGGSNVSHDIVPLKAEELLMDNWVIVKFIDWAAGKKGKAETKKTLREELDKVGADLAGPSPSAVEIVLARTARSLWFTLRLHEAQYDECGTAEGGTTHVQSEFQQRRMNEHIEVS